MIFSRSISFGFVAILAFSFVACGGSSGSTSSSTTRALTGSISTSSLSTLVKQSRFKSLQKATVACTDLQVCCSAYSGDNVVKDIDSSCSFSLDLPLNNFCYCGIFTGTDEDGDGCKDEWVGSLGCSENGYSGAIPIYADDDDTTDAIDVGEGTLQGTRIVTATDICAQVDQDNDGTDDAGDSDNDGDGTADEDDNLNDLGCDDADKFDSDNDGTPDIFQSIWSAFFTSANLSAATKNLEGDEESDLEDEFFTDADDDEIPDACDADVNGEEGCSSVTGDEDGNCIPDELYDCEDEDEDGYDNCNDCDDGDALTTSQCYDSDFCEFDNDGDGLNFCSDCDDSDDRITDECFAELDCNVDRDEDGVVECIDCNDSDSTETDECYAEDDSSFGACESDTIECNNFFDCQKFSENNLTDERTTANSFCFEGCCTTFAAAIPSDCNTCLTGAESLEFCEDTASCTTFCQDNFILCD